MMNKILNRVRLYKYKIRLVLIKFNSPESIDFGNSKSFECYSFEDRYETYIKYVCSLKIIEGLWLEFGVATGETTSRYVQLMPEKAKPLIGFDWFQGLPENWAKHKKGTFSTGGVIPNIDGARMEIGLFKNSLPKFTSINHEDISVLIIDCDTYSATKTIFTHLKNQIQVGTIIIFDELHNGSENYPEWYLHEFKAFSEFIKENELEFEWLAYVSNSEQATARITRK